MWIMSSTPGPDLEKVSMNNNAEGISDSFLYTSIIKEIWMGLQKIDEEKIKFHRHRNNMNGRLDQEFL